MGLYSVRMSNFAYDILFHFFFGTIGIFFYCRFFSFILLAGKNTTIYCVKSTDSMGESAKIQTNCLFSVFFCYGKIAIIHSISDSRREERSPKNMTASPFGHDQRNKCFLMTEITHSITCFTTTIRWCCCFWLAKCLATFFLLTPNKISHFKRIFKFRHQEER